VGPAIMVGLMRTDMRVQIESMLDEYKVLTNRLERVRADVGSVTATARSADGCATATVGPQGELVRLTIDQAAARRLDGATLAARILEASGLAVADARHRVGAIVANCLPPCFSGAVAPDGSVDVQRFLPPDRSSLGSPSAPR